MGELLAISVQQHSVGDLVVVPVMLSRVRRITRDVAYSFKPTLGVCIGTNSDGTSDVFVDGITRRFSPSSVVRVADFTDKLNSIAQVTSGVVPQMFGVRL